MSKSLRFNLTLSRVLQLIVLVYQIIAASAVLMALFLAISWLKKPFLGAFFEPTMIMNGGGPTVPSEAWPLYNQGIQHGDQLISVAGKEIHDAEDMQQALDGFFPGETVQVIAHSVEGDVKKYSVVLQRLPAPDQTAYLVVPFLVSVAFFGLSFWIFGMRRTEPPGRAFTLFASSMAIVAGTFFDLYTTHRLAYLWALALPMAGGALIDLTLSFPKEARAVVGRPYLRWSGYFAALILAGYSYFTMSNQGQPRAYFLAWYTSYFFNAIAILLHLSTTIFRGFFAQSPVVKSQARMVLIGIILSLGPITIWFILFPFNLVKFSPYLFISIIFFPLTIGYTILRYRLVRTDFWLRQGLVYTILTILAVGAYALLVSGISLIFNDTIPSDNPLLIGGIVFVFAILLDPLRARLVQTIDSTFFRGQKVYEQRSRDFSHELTNALDLQSIGRMLRKHILDTLSPEYVHVYTFDPINDQYVSLPDEDGRPSSDIRFPAGSHLAQYFLRERLPLYLDEKNPPINLKTEETRLKLLGAKLFIALPGDNEVTGWLALGQRLSRQPYTPQDLTFLETLANQSSVAIGRVQTVANLERRIQEMNALTRVSQGVNITLTFDDVMELIFAQTGQIIPATEFHVTLLNKAGEYFYYAFCVEDHERLQERENIPLPAKYGLGQEVYEKGRPILTHDYSRECQVRNVTPALQNVYAWMGVPLNAGADTIGALTIGSREANISYSQAQLGLLQAIADQTAGAIVKSRLLQETQQRAYQLSTLNDLTRQLTSTLDLEPLLKNILENAVSILNCEAGSLFLVDEQTEDLVFKVTVGPPASAELVGQRIPAGSGIVGRTAKLRIPVIENQAQSSPARFSATDIQTGFTSKSLLAVPLLFKDQVIGVLEVINRMDGLPFIDDDQTLLSAFAGQAAVAIENARLHTLTDQELAARVEELSVLQRIDRELNASLEIDRAIRTTLDWAMRQSKAEAGLIGMLAEGTLQVMAEQGYGDLVKQYTNESLLDMPAMKSAIQTAQPHQVSLQEKKEDSILPGAHTQIAIPIRREADVVGLIFLESVSDSQQDIAFLNRLSDHAAIAISNSQLYHEVQRANEAKSEFVSFVAHELKNPMTSIKGYTELLAGGAVGSINEMQTNFLHTISSNVERMSTLVSDLNDNSKIEAGRLRLDFKAIGTADTVDEVVRSTRRQIEERKQVLQIQIPDMLPKIWADRDRVIQVLTNLVSNAHKYTPESGEIVIGAEASANRWDPDGAAQVVHLWVKDNGIGISLEDQQKIFTKFFRSDDQKAREAPGTGLGLNITKSLVEMQGGKIWFESKFRKGTAFHFTIPATEE